MFTIGPIPGAADWFAKYHGRVYDWLGIPADAHGFLFWEEATKRLLAALRSERWEGRYMYRMQGVLAEQIIPGAATLAKAKWDEAKKSVTQTEADYQKALGDLSNDDHREAVVGYYSHTMRVWKEISAGGKRRDAKYISLLYEWETLGEKLTLDEVLSGSYKTRRYPTKL